MQQLQTIIDAAWEDRAGITPANAKAEVRDAVLETIELLDSGRLRVAEKRGGQWVTHEWAKKAVLLSFRLQDNEVMEDGYTRYYDKVPSKFAAYDGAAFQAGGFRVVPPAAVREGAYIAQKRGADAVVREHRRLRRRRHDGRHLGDGRLVRPDRQERPSLRAASGIGGVLEPLQANPTIIEDNCFIGARSEIVEGVIVEEGSVISMGVFIGASTKIYRRDTGEVLYGRVPPGRSSCRARSPARTAAATSIAP